MESPTLPPIEPEMRACPHCGKDILARATRCRFCRNHVDGPTIIPVRGTAGDASPTTIDGIPATTVEVSGLEEAPVPSTRADVDDRASSLEEQSGAVATEVPTNPGEATREGVAAASSAETSMGIVPAAHRDFVPESWREAMVEVAADLAETAPVRGEPGTPTPTAPSDAPTAPAMKPAPRSEVDPHPPRGSRAGYAVTASVFLVLVLMWAGTRGQDALIAVGAGMRIQPAIDRAPPGAIIELSGEHHESIRVAKPLTLRGRPGFRIHANADPVIHVVGCEGVVLEELRVSRSEAKGEPRMGLLVADDASLEVRNCDFARGRNGIAIRGSSGDPTVGVGRGSTSGK